MSSPGLATLANTVENLIDAAASLTADTPSRSDLNAIVGRGRFRPSEDEAIGYWFARYLTIRGSLWIVIDDVVAILGGRTSRDDHELRYFLVGYAAVCVLVGIDRVMLFDVAWHSVVQRKLNEAFQELRIPRKQFTRIFEAFVDEQNALALLDAMRFAKKNSRRLLALRQDPVVGPIAAQLPALRKSLDLSKRAYLRGLWAYVSHKWRRRGVVTMQNVLSGVVEGVGRAASDIQLTSIKNVTDDVRAAISKFLQPGDVLITRHATALTNLFMPGFWPHAALYVGTARQREAMNIAVDAGIRALWTNGISTLEALKDGVRLRPLSDTLNVDYFVVLRPKLPVDTIRQAIERSVVHTGKMYNFDFDFFSSDRLVCTEVIYRSYDGLGGVEFPLTERAGRKTLSAEDLLDFALETGVFEPVAIYGVEGCEQEIVTGDRVVGLLTASYGALYSARCQPKT